MSFNTITSQLPSIYTPKRRSTMDHTSALKTPKNGSYVRKLTPTRNRSKVLTETTEHELVTDIRKLDSTLEKKMDQVGAYLFSTDSNLRLTQAISEELRRHKGLFELECFSSVLERPEEAKESPYIHGHSVYRRIRQLGKQNQASFFEGSARNLILADSPKVTNIFNQHDLNLFLTQQRSPVSLWAPPVSYPRFVAYFSLGKVYVTSTKARVLKIEKFYTPNYVAPGPMFDNLLEYARKTIDAGIANLELTTTKSIYQNKFKKWGWDVKGIKDTNWRIWYTDSEPSPYEIN